MGGGTSGRTVHDDGASRHDDRASRRGAGRPRRGGRARATLIATAALSAGLAASDAGVAGEAPGGAPHATHATLAVGATVLPRTTLESRAMPATLEIDAADVARGYVDVPAAARITVWNTDPAGYAVDLWPTAPLFAALEIATGDARAELSGGGGTLVARGAHGRDLPLVLDVRFRLAPGVAPGRYPWPLALQVRSFSTSP